MLPKDLCSPNFFWLLTASRRILPKHLQRQSSSFLQSLSSALALPTEASQRKETLETGLPATECRSSFSLRFCPTVSILKGSRDKALSTLAVSKRWILGRSRSEGCFCREKCCLAFTCYMGVQCGKQVASTFRRIKALHRLD